MIRRRTRWRTKTRTRQGHESTRPRHRNYDRYAGLYSRMSAEHNKPSQEADDPEEDEVEDEDAQEARPQAPSPPRRIKTVHAAIWSPNATNKIACVIAGRSGCRAHFRCGEDRGRSVSVPDGLCQRWKMLRVVDRKSPPPPRRSSPLSRSLHGCTPPRRRHGDTCCALRHVLDWAPHLCLRSTPAVFNRLRAVRRIHCNHIPQ